MDAFMPTQARRNMAVRREFQVLSAISSEEDVFDNLLPVRDIISGLEGLLLCSEACTWPQDLVYEATWLEGCYTPRAVKDDPRLALGFHPYTETRWKYHSGVLRLSTQTTEGWISVIKRTKRAMMAYLEGIHLPEVDLCGVDLWKADLRGANLQGADLRGADLRRANLQGADLQGADLRGAKLLEANLLEADLRGADLWGALVEKATLQKAKT